MQQLPLIGGSYSARSPLANAQRCLNLYPENNRRDAGSPVTHYQRPGLAALVSSMTSGIARCAYQASNGDCYVVVGRLVYFIDSSWTPHQVGQILPGTSICSMVDNGLEVLLVTGRAYAGNASGSFDFAANPSNGQTLTLNGVVWTFVTGAPAAHQTQIQVNVILTMDALTTDVTNSTTPALTGAIYSFRDPGAGAGTFVIQSKSPGAIGTAYTLAASTATPSGPHLTIGGWGDVTPPEGYVASLGDMANNAFVLISDTNWTGADRVDFLDTFILWNVPGTNQFMCTTSNAVLPIDTGNLAAKTSWADALAGVVACRGEVFVPGVLKSETWYNAGNTNFPFARLPGTETPHGVFAKYSLAVTDLNIYWLHRDLAGQCMVLRLRGHETKRISNFALEYQLRVLYQAGVDLSDAVGYTQQFDGHLFYVLNFPTANQTWVWDESQAEPEMGWSQRGFTGAGGFSRDRVLLGASFYGKNVGLDWQTGVLYEQKLDYFTDDVGGTQYPITFTRSFPHLMSGLDARGQPALANGLMIQHDAFILDASVGTAESGTVGPVFSLRWSDDRGQSWGQAVLQSAGETGKFITRPKWAGVGQAMDRVYEVSWSFPGKVALQGAWVDGKVMSN